MKIPCWRRGFRVGVPAALLVVGLAAFAGAEGSDNEFVVQYLKGKRGFSRKMDGVIVLVDDSLRFRNRGGDRAFTVALDSAQARVITKQKQRIGCWAGLLALSSTMMFDPERQCLKTEYLIEVEVAGPGGTERVMFKPKAAKVSALVSAINQQGRR